MDGLDYDQASGGLLFNGRCLTRLIERVPTPNYIYDEQLISRNLRHITSAIPYCKTDCHYAVVSNNSWPVLQTIIKNGWTFHLNSPFELELVKTALAYHEGLSAEAVMKILRSSVFSGGSITDENMKSLLEHDVFVHVTSLAQLKQYAELAQSLGKSIEVGLRVWFDSNMQYGRQGITPSEIETALEISQIYSTPITSIHMYRGTGTNSISDFTAPFTDFFSLASRLPDLKYIDIGGGFGYDYKSADKSFDWNSFGKAVSTFIEDANRYFGRQLTLKIEAGRSVVANAGVFATRVLSRKVGRSPKEVILGVDASSMSTKAAAPNVVRERHRLFLLNKRKGDDIDEKYTLVGPTTYTMDYLRKKAEIKGIGQSGIEINDVIVIADCGAYGAVTYSEFLSTPKPAQTFIGQDGEIILASRHGFAEDLTRYWAEERIPV